MLLLVRLLARDQDSEDIGGDGNASGGEADDVVVAMDVHLPWGLYADIPAPEHLDFGKPKMGLAANSPPIAPEFGAFEIPKDDDIELVVCHGRVRSDRE